MKEYVWGVDLGGTKIEGAILDSSKNFAVVERMRVPTESPKGYGHILDQIEKLIQLMREKVKSDPESIGFGTPGTLDPLLQTLKNSNTTCLNGQYLKRDLEQRLRMEIKMANDANCFALAETKMGIVKEKCPEAEVVFGVIMGTGVGGGLVVNGQIVAGKQGIGGEWGHNFLDESGGPCYCGKTGCVEKVISGTGLEKYYRERSGTFRKLKDIVEDYRLNNDPLATEVMDRLLSMFGKAISVVINIVDPDVIVLGGGVGNIDELYIQGVEQAAKYVFNNRLETAFLKPKLGDSAGVFGAALL